MGPRRRRLKTRTEHGDEWAPSLPDVKPELVEAVRRAHMRRVNKKTVQLLLACVQASEEFDGSILSRQFYYELVRRGSIKNSPWSPGNLRSHLRAAIQPTHGWISPFEVARWWNRTTDIEVWARTSNVSFLIASICNAQSARFIFLRGSAHVEDKQIRTSTVLQDAVEDGLKRFDIAKPVRLLFLADLDPEAEDTFAYVAQRLDGIDVKRVALLPEQTNGLHPNPSWMARNVDALGDSWRAFHERYPQLGGYCYELASLPPRLLRELVYSAIHAARSGGEANAKR